MDITFSGTTAVTGFMKNYELRVANSGDSRCIIGSYKNSNWSVKEITKDHKPCVESEAERIIENGGRIQPYILKGGECCGPLRVWLLDEDIPGLAMTRSIGDLVASSVGVSWEPEVTKYKISQNDRFMIMATDGVWEFLENVDVSYLGNKY